MYDRMDSRLPPEVRRRMQELIAQNAMPKYRKDRSRLLPRWGGPDGEGHAAEDAAAS